MSPLDIYTYIENREILELKKNTHVEAVYKIGRGIHLK